MVGGGRWASRVRQWHNLTGRAHFRRGNTLFTSRVSSNHDKFLEEGRRYILMATILTEISVMKAAILLVAGNET
jgi:hypothetical protein